MYELGLGLDLGLDGPGLGLGLEGPGLDLGLEGPGLGLGLGLEGPGLVNIPAEDSPRLIHVDCRTSLHCRDIGVDICTVFPS